ncbi:MAG: hypothetical protein AB1405_15240 [Bdellovibrionota bacterium]
MEVKHSYKCFRLGNITCLAFLFLTAFSACAGGGECEGTGWARAASMSNARSGVRIAVLNGRIYAAGGYSGIGEQYEEASWTDVMEEYDPVADEWASKADLPEPLYQFAFAAANGKLYSINVNTYEYDPIGNSWTPKLDPPDEIVTGAAIGDTIYAFSIQDDLYSYNTVSNTWSNILAPVDEFYDGGWPVSSAVLDGRFYVLGADFAHPWDPLRRLFEYDPGENEWTEKATAIAPLVFRGLAASSTRLYAVGGQVGGKSAIDSEVGISQWVEAFFAEGNSWSGFACLGAARSDPGVAWYNGKLYAIGGGRGPESKNATNSVLVTTAP